MDTHTRGERDLEHPTWAEAAGKVSFSEEKVEVATDAHSTAASIRTEAKLVRKIDLLVMPILWVCLVALQLDRANIGNALTDNLMRDIGINQATLSTGQTLLQSGIVIFELPSNIVLYRIGPKLWITLQILAWGSVATFQAFMKNREAFLATRFLLGAFEAGFVPASFYTLTLWYKPSELSKRFSIFYSGSLFASALSGLVAYGILQMRGVANLAGWQWLFLLEGIFTILACGVFAVMFPGSPANPKSLFRVDFFSEEEKAILSERMRISQALGDGAHSEKKKIGVKNLLQTFADLKMWPHLIMAFVCIHPALIYNLFGPTIIGSFGFDVLRANALTSVGQWISLVLLVSMGFLADWWNHRGLLTMITTFFTFIMVMTFKLLPFTASMNTKYAVMTLGIATSTWFLPLNMAWLALNARNSQDRAIRLALIAMANNLGGVSGPQLLRAEDAPQYAMGWSILTGLVALGFACAVGLVVTYAWLNARTKKKHPGLRVVHDGFATDGVRFWHW